ncbi:hypothetical protein AYI69_g3283 [Smittium culicis]|uniref:Sec20 C-terminal domain-containing protein n=1 Tax=Smittium culicis TaxID=133412 RepID=A0A1R1X8Y7_9FUNG|nr:hypothetical protein AYI69_g9989 [Smittium culicis]OMJ27282.1 hypothetical protein AYI69_g3283 [Smittium culicis]
MSDYSSFNDQLEALNQLIDDLYEFVGSENKRQILIDQIQDSLKELNSLLQDFEFELEANPQPDSSLDSFIKSKKEDLSKSRRDFRQAILQNKVNRSKKFSNERQALLSGAITPSEFRKNKARSQNKVVDAAQDATQALRDTAQLMNRELQVSVANVAALEESSRLLYKNKEQHENISQLLNLTKSLLTELERADWVDRVLIILAFIVFSIVALNIFRKRIWFPFIPSIFSSSSPTNSVITSTQAHSLSLSQITTTVAASTSIAILSTASNLKSAKIAQSISNSPATTTIALPNTPSTIPATPSETIAKLLKNTPQNSNSSPSQTKPTPASTISQSDLPKPGSKPKPEHQNKLKDEQNQKSIKSPHHDSLTPPSQKIEL